MAIFVGLKHVIPIHIVQNDSVFDANEPQLGSVRHRSGNTLGTTGGLSAVGTSVCVVGILKAAGVWW
ncbi:hypothetical protein [Snodgrassella alvi]|uniref:hypothetical protein n=1 Tax=Snodgrassella alvi TaxID=1196083 RepID=UPI003514169C